MRTRLSLLLAILGLVALAARCRARPQDLRPAVAPGLRDAGAPRELPPDPPPGGTTSDSAPAPRPVWEARPLVAGAAEVAGPAVAQGWPPASAPWDESYAPSRERFLEVAEALEGPLDEQLLDLAQLPSDFWVRWGTMAWVLQVPRAATLADALPGLDVRGEAARLWEDPTTQAIWRAHQLLFAEQAQLQLALQGLRGVEARAPFLEKLAQVGADLDELRAAIWSASPDPALEFLCDLERELRR